MKPLRRYQPLVGGSRSYATLAFSGETLVSGVLALGTRLAYAGEALADGALSLSGLHRYAGSAVASGDLFFLQPSLGYIGEAQAAGDFDLGTRLAYAGEASADGALALGFPPLRYAGVALAVGSVVLLGPTALAYFGEASARGVLSLEDQIAALAADHVYVVNVETGAVSRYEGFGVTSMADVGGDTYGVGPGGLFVMGGSTRAGQPIASFVRSGLFAPGGNLLTRLRDVRLVLQMVASPVVVVGSVENGRIVERWYLPPELPGSSSRERVCKIGRGPVSLFWRLEVHNRAGEPGDIDRIDIHADPLSRRTIS